MLFPKPTMKSENEEKSIFHLPKLSLISLLVAMVLIVRFLTQIVPGHVIPGDGNAARTSVLIIGKGLLPQFGSCTIINFVAGVLISLLMPSKEGLLTFVKYLTTGVMLDLLYFILKDYPRKPILAGIAGTIASLTKLATQMVTVHFVLGISWNVLFVGMITLSTTHIFFGFVFGFGAALIFRQLDTRFQYLFQSKKI